jgi:thymidylate kinase
MTTAEQLRAPVRQAPATLIERLAEALEGASIGYCQWKGHTKRNRWLTGAGDLDLLVDPAAWPALVELLLQLGFKRAVAPPWLQLPGVESYLGYDQAGGPLVHVHAYHRIVIGPPWRTTYTVPLVETVLAGAKPGFLVRAPAPEHELLLTVLQAAQRCTVRDIVQPRRSDWIAALRRELQRLEPKAEWSELTATIERDLPSVSVRLFERCLDAFLSGASRWRTCVLARALTLGLRPFARPPALGATPRAIMARLASAVGLPGPVEGKGLVTGGRVLALVGGDGAGKTTCATELTAWLGREVATLRVHLGRPPRSLTTLAVGAALKVAQWLHQGVAAHFELLRCVCTARDRYRLYRRAWRFAARGGVVIAERYPIPANYALCGPSEEQGVQTGLDTRVARLLRRVEWTYYEWMRPPDATIVLQLDPELAVSRKTDEPEDYVRERVQIVWDTDWAAVDGAFVVDAARALPEVLSDLKSLVWSLI